MIQPTLHFVHQLVSNCVCLLFAAEQGVYDGFLKSFVLENEALRALIVKQNSKVFGQTAKQ